MFEHVKGTAFPSGVTIVSSSCVPFGQASGVDPSPSLSGAGAAGVGAAGAV